MNNQTKQPMYQMRKIMSWVYWSTNSRFGYAALLECGHKRMDLTQSRAKAHDALCWECIEEESNGERTSVESL